MVDIRGSVRRIPFSTDVYEYVDTHRRMRGSRRVVQQILESGREVKLDLGGGYTPGRNGWINVDVSREADLFWDLRYGIPFPDGSVAHVYSSHLFEHLTFDQGQRLLTEARRVLAPGGSISIVVPNARLYIEAYVNGQSLPEEYLGWEPANNHSTSIDLVNYIAYMGGEHQYLFDQENLLFVLRKAGFVNVEERGFDPLTDLAERDYESIYAIGFKEAAPSRS